MDLESEDDSGPETLTVNPYPLEGIYKDERDRSRCVRRIACALKPSALTTRVPSSLSQDHGVA